MRISIAIMIASLLAAIGCSMIAEKLRAPAGARWAWLGLFAIYGVCIGVVSTLMTYFFDLREWIAIAISIPLGVPALLIAAKMSEG